MRWLSPLLAALALMLLPGAVVNVPIGHDAPVQRVVIYGDSLSDNNDAADCDWCSALVADGVTIWNAATGGARTYDDAAACAAGDSYANCQFYIERQMVHFDSACRVGTATSKNGFNSQAFDTPLYGGAGEVPTCVEDLPINSQTTIVIFAGTNDITRVSNAAWQSTYFALTKAAYQSMLGAVYDNETTCVIVIPPYVYDSANGYDQANLNLGELADYLDGTAATSIADDMGASYPDQCVVVDMRDVIDAYTAAHDLQTTLDDLYFDCDSVGNEGTLSGCIHFSTAGSDLLGASIYPAIKTARGRIRQAYIQTVMPSGSGPVASCTDGVDCRCDLLIAEFGAAIAFCEDGEHPNLANTLDTRGEWHTLYNGSGAVDTCLIDNVEGFPWRVGFIGDPEAAAAGRECMHHASEANCGVPGQTDCVADGTYSIGHVMNPNKNQGITGDADFIGGRQTEFGITMLIKLSANAVVPGGSNGPAFKPNEWGDGFHPLLGFGGYAQGTPADTPNNYPFIGGLLTSSAASNATMTLGTATANQFGIYYGGSTGLYNWGSTWNVDQWACWQWHGSGLGGTAHVRMWFNETKILEGDFPTSNLLGDTSGIGKIHWNNYYNGPGNPGDGYPGATQAIRYEDNVVAFIGSEPLPCSAIGWVAP